MGLGGAAAGSGSALAFVIVVLGHFFVLALTAWYAVGRVDAEFWAQRKTFAAGPRTGSRALVVVVPVVWFVSARIYAEFARSWGLLTALLILVLGTVGFWFVSLAIARTNYQVDT